MLRAVLVIAATAAAVTSASAQVMNAEATRDFVAGKFFYYKCFDGTSGAGRIFSDGSAIGTLKSSNRPNVRHVALPVGTIAVKKDRICANLKGLYFEPCFTVTRTGPNSFRGSINGMSFMSCEFNGMAPTQQIASSSTRKRSPRTGILAGAAEAKQ